MYDQDPRKFLIAIVQRNRSVLLCEGFAFVILGLLALLAPGMFAIALDIFLGVLALVAAGILLVRLFSEKELPNRSSTIMQLIIYLALGLFLLFYPLTGVLTMNLVLASFLVFDGIFKMTSSMQLRPTPGWGWIFFSGFLSFVLAILIMMAWPTGAPWILGIFIGINLLFTGIFQLSLVWSLPKE